MFTTKKYEREDTFDGPSHRNLQQHPTEPFIWFPNLFATDAGQEVRARSPSYESSDLSCLCSSLQQNHFLCNKNTNPDLRAFFEPGEEKGEEKTLAGNRLYVFKSKLSIYVTLSTGSQVHFKLGKWILTNI